MTMPLLQIQEDYQMIALKKSQVNLSHGGRDGHSHSWLTLKELMDYRRDHNKTKYSGFITNEQAAELENGITPDSWCQGTNMSGYVHRKWEDEITPSFTDLLSTLIDRACEEFWIYDNDSKSQAVKNIAEDVRIVFWFDN